LLFLCRLGEFWERILVYGDVTRDFSRLPAVCAATRRQAEVVRVLRAQLDSAQEKAGSTTAAYQLLATEDGLGRARARQAVERASPMLAGLGVPENTAGTRLAGSAATERGSASGGPGTCCGRAVVYLPAPRMGALHHGTTTGCSRPRILPRPGHASGEGMRETLAAGACRHA
jgi:hypothetical protein